MPDCRPNPRILSIYLITFSVLALAANGPVKNGPYPVVQGIEVFDTPRIVINWKIKDSFPCVDDLLQRMISDDKGIFKQSAFKAFFTAVKMRLTFSDSLLSEDFGGKSFGVGFDRGNFDDTIFLNRLFFTKASREYIASVVIHETVHAYITWCCLSYKYHLNEVDQKYLEKHFRSHLEYVTDTAYADDWKQHALMAKSFIGIMIKTLYRYTNHQSDATLRDLIARSLTWAGLSETPAWKDLSIDTCYVHDYDIWSRHFLDAKPDQVTKFGDCPPASYQFLQRLQLDSICQH